MLVYCFFYSHPLGVVEINVSLLWTLTTFILSGFLVYLIGQIRMRSLEYSQQVMISWVGNTAHDLMAPIGAIQGYAEILDLSLEANYHEDDCPPYAKNILDLCYRLEGMAGDLTNISVVRTKTKPLNMEIMSLTDMTRRVLTLYDLPQHDSPSFHFFSSTSKYPILCHPNLAERAIQNLLQNADRYSPKGSSVGIRISQKGQQVCLQVVNTGFSETPLEWETLFKRHQRGAVNLGKGSGLGLSIVQEIMAIHNGEVSVSKVDKQITFTLSFPLPAKHHTR